MRSGKSRFKIVPRRVSGEIVGSFRSGRFGDGEVEVGTQLYEFGDDDHHVDWNAYASDSEEELSVFIHQEEQRLPVAIIVDTRPTMALFPEDEPPQLHKPTALRFAIDVIAGAIVAQNAVWSYVDLDDPEQPSVMLRREPREVGRIQQRIAELHYDAPVAALDKGVGRLLTARPKLAKGTECFVFTDGYVMPSEETLRRARHAWLQLNFCFLRDAWFERNFPDGSWYAAYADGGVVRPNASGFVVPFIDPESGRVTFDKVTKRNATELHRENRERTRILRETLRPFGFDAIELDTHEPLRVEQALIAWSNRRAKRRR